MPEPAALMVTLVEAADVLGISRTQAYKLAQTGEFPVPVHRIGRVWRVPRRPLEAYVGAPIDDVL